MERRGKKKTYRNNILLWHIMIPYCGLSVDSSCFNLDNTGSNLQLDSGLTQSADSSEWKIQHINHSDSSIEMYINIIDSMAGLQTARKVHIGWDKNCCFAEKRRRGKKKIHLCPCQWSWDEKWWNGDLVLVSLGYHDRTAAWSSPDLNKRLIILRNT